MSAHFCHIFSIVNVRNVILFRFLFVSVPPELPQQNVCKEEDVFADQPRFDQERNSSLSKEEPEPLQIKEEEEELYTSQEGELLVLSGPGTFVVTPTKLKSDQQVLFNNSNVAESQDQKESEHGSTGAVEPKPKKRHKKSKRNHNSIRPTFSEIHCNTRIKFSCDVCGKDFKQKSKLNIHLKRHTSEESHICKTCGKCCKKLSHLREHVKIHAGGNQYSCDTCGKTFSRTYELKIHKRTHTDEKPYGCVFCGKRFSQSSAFKRHMSSHTGEKLYTCKTCGRAFTCPTYLMVHMRMHTG